MRGGLSRRGTRARAALRRALGRGDRKAAEELGYWEERLAAEGRLANDHYEWFYTGHFGLDRAFYRGRRVLDVGCGPRGSLEWAHGAAERVGLDPLAGEYLALGGAAHAMDYVAGGAEAIPFADGHFDVVCSFNSLDHVDDLGAAARELARVVAPGGLLLVLTDVGHEPTFTEPQEISWDVLDRFPAELERIEVRRYERHEGGVYASVLAGVPYDDGDPSRRYGVLSAKLRRPG